MALFDRNLWVSKLRKLNNTQQSIQTVSQWAMFYAPHFKAIIESWHQELIQSQAEKKLILLYLCNDIIQTSRKETNDFVDEFAPYLLKDIPDLVTDPECTESHKSKINRVMDIWQERSVYSAEYIADIRQNFTRNHFSSNSKYASTSASSSLKPTPDSYSNSIGKSVAGSTLTPAPASPVANFQSNNQLVKLYIEMEQESVTDALVSIEAEDFARDILSHPSSASLRELEQAETVLKQHRDRLASTTQRREKILHLLQEYLERETRALKQGQKDLLDCEKNLEDLNTLIQPKKHSQKRPRN